MMQRLAMRPAGDTIDPISAGRLTAGPPAPIGAIPAELLGPSGVVHSVAVGVANAAPIIAMTGAIAAASSVAVACGLETVRRNIGPSLHETTAPAEDVHPRARHRLPVNSTELEPTTPDGDGSTRVREGMERLCKWPM